MKKNPVERTLYVIPDGEEPPPPSLAMPRIWPRLHCYQADAIRTAIMWRRSIVRADPGAGGMLVALCVANFYFDAGGRSEPVMIVAPGMLVSAVKLEYRRTVGDELPVFKGRNKVGDVFVSTPESAMKFDARPLAGVVFADDMLNRQTLLRWSLRALRRLVLMHSKVRTLGLIGLER